jgi:hypothetical protein
MELDSFSAALPRCYTHWGVFPNLVKTVLKIGGVWQR